MLRGNDIHRGAERMILTLEIWMDFQTAGGMIEEVAAGTK